MHVIDVKNRSGSVLRVESFCPSVVEIAVFLDIQCILPSYLILVTHETVGFTQKYNQIVCSIEIFADLKKNDT